MDKLQNAMFANERDAGGLLQVQVRDGVPYQQIWFCGGGTRGEQPRLFAKVTIASWFETSEVATMLAETIEFIGRKKREPVTQLWINPEAQADLEDALGVFANPETGPQENYVNAPTQPAVD